MKRQKFNVKAVISIQQNAFWAVLDSPFKQILLASTNPLTHLLLPKCFISVSLLCLDFFNVDVFQLDTKNFVLCPKSIRSHPVV
jgi:hypothetical protein